MLYVTTKVQNSIAKVVNCTLVEMAHAMLYTQGLGYAFWTRVVSRVVSNGVYTHSRCLTSVVASMTNIVKSIE